MGKRSNFTSIGFKVKALSSLVLLISISLLTLLSVYTINQKLIKNMQEDGLALVKQFASQINMSNSTTAALDKQLDEKLKSVAYSLAPNNGLSNEYLSELGKKIGVAEIDVTGPDRKIIYSNINENLGWAYPEDHPVDPLFKGSKKEVIEDVRQSKTDKKYYKYGEIALQSGGILQVGILADDIQKIKAGIETQSLLADIAKNPNVVYACVIGKDLKITAHTDPKRIGVQLNDIGSKTAAVDEKPYNSTYFYAVKNAKVYDVLVPLYKDGKHVGAVDVALSMESLNAAKKQLIFQSLILVAIFFIIGAICLTILTNNIINPIKHLVKTSKMISEGDLEQQIIVKNNDEVGLLAESFNSMILNIKKMVTGIHSATTNVSEYSNDIVISFENATAVSEEIAATAQTMSEASKTQERETKDIAENIKEVIETITLVKDEVNDVVKNSDETSNLIQSGNAKIQDMSEQMNKIRNSVNTSSEAIYNLESISNEIGNIVEIINGIATQTNLLALNASIEAARAGESGRGFAVVADEVRKLAEESVKSAENIKNLISKTQENTKKALMSIQRGTEEVELGESTVKNLEDFMNNVLNASNVSKNKLWNTNNKLVAMYKSTDKIYSNINEIENISQQSSTNISEIADSIEKQTDSIGKISSNAQNLMELISELNDVVNKFNSSSH